MDNRAEGEIYLTLRLDTLPVADERMDVRSLVHLLSRSLPHAPPSTSASRSSISHTHTHPTPIHIDALHSAHLDRSI